MRRLLSAVSAVAVLVGVVGVGSAFAQYGETPMHSLVGRYSYGNVYTAELALKLGMSETNRLHIGVNAEWAYDLTYALTRLTEDSDDVLQGEGFGVGVTVFYEWKFNVTPDGFFSISAGPGVLLNYTETEWLPRYPQTWNSWRWERSEGVIVGFGANISAELNLGGLVDRGMSMYRNTVFGIDVRPLFVVPFGVKHYPQVTCALGIYAGYSF